MILTLLGSCYGSRLNLGSIAWVQFVIGSESNFQYEEDVAKESVNVAASLAIPRYTPSLSVSPVSPVSLTVSPETSKEMLAGEQRLG